jgi:hypothetical protein
MIAATDDLVTMTRRLGYATWGSWSLRSCWSLLRAFSSGSAKASYRP